MKFNKIDRVKLSSVFQPLLGEEKAFHMNHGGVTKINPKTESKRKITPKRNQQTSKL